MAQLTSEQVQHTLESCCARLAEVGENFRANLGCELRVTAETPRPYADSSAAELPEGPGLAVSFVLGEQGLLLLIPETVSLPEWYRNPDVSENNRLQTFAHELSLQLLPEDLQAERFSATAVASLKEVAEQAQIDPSAMALDLPVFATSAAETDAPLARLFLVIPVDASRLDLQAEQGVASGEGSATESPFGEALADFSDAGSEAATGGNGGSTAATSVSVDEALRALRILNVPVTVSVRLAERKMPLGQVVALVPGALVPFNKSCEDLLDLFVNNHRYCQGEAIKIGENFGLKVAKVGVTEERKEHIL